MLIELKRQDDEWLILNHKNSPTFKVILTDINLDVPSELYIFFQLFQCHGKCVLY